MIIPIRKFRASDLEIIVPNSNNKLILEMPWQDWGKYDEKYSVGYTGCVDGVPIGSMGIRPHMRPGYGTAWAYLTESVNEHKLSGFRTAKLMLGYILEACDYTHIRASARHDLHGADVLLKHLGFKRVRQMVCGNKDYYLLKVKK